MNINDDTKRFYQPPRLKVVSFTVEQGFNSLLGLDVMGTESYSRASYGSSGSFWDPGTTDGGATGTENYNRFSGSGSFWGD